MMLYNDEMWRRPEGWGGLLRSLELCSAVALANSGQRLRCLPLWPPELMRSKRIYVCPDGVDPELFRYSPMPHRHRGEPLVVGWAGSSTRRWHRQNKGLDLIHEAVAKLRGRVELRLADREGEYIPHERMPAWYSSIDVYVCMSACEGTPNPILEASACGRPWISTEVGIVPDLLADSVELRGEGTPCGWMVGRDPDQLADTLWLAWQQRERLAAMGLAGRRVIERRWTFGLLTRIRRFSSVSEFEEITKQQEAAEIKNTYELAILLFSNVFSKELLERSIKEAKALKYADGSEEERKRLRLIKTLQGIADFLTQKVEHSN